ncbi:DUF1015 domain-containing protein [Clostridium grantii]|uniref:Uncharacterized conserved protein, DUF1015 family n=1 Tax=Clostridium grantii DSM 8605 TaxID=1121316 RepID=A0A1M5XIC7_9CLOT|nr:DUF1015 family protein [Clostridium grantii]SHH99625.1 Uncharacterized conserved protein, DUF1015 family [Clostridium grantii DSM 8605]
MVCIKAFKAVRPSEEFPDKVAALPYDVMSSEEARIMVENNPYSFLHIDKAEIDLGQDTNPYDKIVYEKAKENLNDFIDKGIFVKENKECLYVYRLIMQGRVQTGIVFCASVDDYINNKIKKHEHTREEKEIDRINHVDYCNANTGPIFLTYKNSEEINLIVEQWINSNETLYNFKSEDEITHIVWRIENEEVVNKLIKLYENIPEVYIADGHHRCASAAKVATIRRNNKVNFKGHEEFNYFLSVAFPHKDLYIMDYNRIVEDLNGLSVKQFLKKIEEKFSINIYQGTGPIALIKRGTFGMYLEQQWYELKIKEDLINKNDLVKSLDVSILQDYLLKPILGIQDPRKDKRIDFVGGIRGLKELEKRVDEGMKVAFLMYPTSIEDLMSIADIDEVMPPKSTWFEPKLRSGLFIHELE